MTETYDKNLIAKSCYKIAIIAHDGPRNVNVIAMVEMSKQERDPKAAFIILVRKINNMLGEILDENMNNAEAPFAPQGQINPRNG